MATAGVGRRRSGTHRRAGRAGVGVRRRLALRPSTAAVSVTPGARADYWSADGHGDRRRRGPTAGGRRSGPRPAVRAGGGVYRQFPEPESGTSGCAAVADWRFVPSRARPRGRGRGAAELPRDFDAAARPGSRATRNPIVLWTALAHEPRRLLPDGGGAAGARRRAVVQRARGGDARGVEARAAPRARRAGLSGWVGLRVRPPTGTRIADER